MGKGGKARNVLSSTIVTSIGGLSEVQNFPELFGELVQTERLLEQMGFLIKNAVMNDRVAGISGRIKYFEALSFGS